MKVVVVSSLPDRAQGGVEKVVRDLVDTLRGRGVETYLITNGESASFADRGHRVLPMPPIETWHGVPTIPCVIAVTRALGRVLAFLLEVRPSVVHVHFLDYPLLYWVIFRGLFRYRLLVTGHGSEVNVLGRSGERSVAEKLFVRLARMADVRTATARQIADTFSSATGREVVTVANGVDTDFWGSGGGSTVTEPSTVRLVAVGRLTPEKGFDVLLRALGLVVGFHSECRCTIIGDGVERQGLMRLAGDLGLLGIVSFPGMLGSEEIRECLRNAEIFVLASRDEGLPLAMLEAMAAGLAVVATRVGGIPEVVSPDEGILVNPGDPEALAGAIRQLLESDGRRQVMRASASRRARDFSLQVAVDGYLRLYERSV